MQVVDPDAGLHGRQLAEDLQRGGGPLVPLPAEVVAVDRDQHLGPGLGEPVEDAAHAEVGCAHRPHRADGRGGEEGDHGVLGVRQVRRDAVTGLDAEAP